MTSKTWPRAVGQTVIDTSTTGPAPLLLGARQAAEMCGVSRSTWWALHAAGRIPLPVRLGRRTLWAVTGPKGLTAWIVAECPSRDRWEVIREGQP